MERFPAHLSEECPLDLLFLFMHPVGLHTLLSFRSLLFFSLAWRLMRLEEYGFCIASPVSSSPVPFLPQHIGGTSHVPPSLIVLLPFSDAGEEDFSEHDLSFFRPFPYFERFFPLSVPFLSPLLRTKGGITGEVPRPRKNNGSPRSDRSSIPFPPPIFLTFAFLS